MTELPPLESLTGRSSYVAVEHFEAYYDLRSPDSEPYDKPEPYRQRFISRVLNMCVDRPRPTEFKDDGLTRYQIDRFAPYPNLNVRNRHEVGYPPFQIPLGSQKGIGSIIASQFVLESGSMQDLSVSLQTMPRLKNQAIFIRDLGQYLQRL